MKQHKVKDYPGLMKVNGAFVVNNDKEAYRAAILRQKQAKENKNLKKRVDALESRLDEILNMLKSNQGSGK